MSVDIIKPSVEQQGSDIVNTDSKDVPHVLFFIDQVDINLHNLHNTRANNSIHQIVKQLIHLLIH